MAGASRGFTTPMASPTLDSESRRVRVSFDFLVQTDRLYVTRTLGGSALRGPRQLDDGKVPPAFHELDDQVEATRALATAIAPRAHRPPWPCLEPDAGIR